MIYLAVPLPNYPDMKTPKLQRRTDLTIIEGLQRIEFSFPDMHSLLDFVEEIQLHTIEFNRGNYTLICKCTGQQALLAQKKYKAKIVDQRNVE
jgi:hypothetical protein